MGEPARALRNRLGAALLRWGTALQSHQPAPQPPTALQDNATAERRAKAAAPMAKRPGVRLPLSVDRAVKNRDLSVLRREAADALAAFGSAHALVTSARLAQLQGMVAALEQGDASEETLHSLAVEYQAWQSDQVRLFDALRLVLGIEVPSGRALDQIDPRFHGAAHSHLGALSVEYQRLLLSEQFRHSEAGE